MNSRFLSLFAVTKRTECPLPLLQHMLSYIKGGLSRLRQIFAPESPLKMMKNVFYFTLKALSVRKVFKFLSTF